jgi:hypothetical protein
MLSNPGKLLILTQYVRPQVLHDAFSVQKLQVLASTASVGLAEVDDAKAATTARTTAEEKRIVCESCDMRSDN